MSEILRIFVFDLDENTPKYDDDTVERLLVVSAQLVEGELDFSHQYIADIPGRDITPDPTDSDGGTRDDSFINLACMRAAAIVQQGEARLESGIVIRDNGSTVDLHYKLQGALALVKDGWQRRYDQEKFAYQTGQLTGKVAGQAVVGSFREFARGYWGEYARPDWRDF